LDRTASCAGVSGCAAASKRVARHHERIIAPLSTSIHSGLRQLHGSQHSSSVLPRKPTALLRYQIPCSACVPGRRHALGILCRAMARDSCCRKGWARRLALAAHCMVLCRGLRLAASACWHAPDLAVGTPAWGCPGQHHLAHRGCAAIRERPFMAPAGHKVCF
jgi:hypothetical protein